MTEILNNPDLLLNLFSEGVGIVVTVLIITPIISYMVSKRNAALEAQQRRKMADPLRNSFSELKREILEVVNGPDGDFVDAGIEAVRRKVNDEIPAGPYNPSYEVALGSPMHICSALLSRSRTKRIYVSELVRLFSVHFRASDAVLAQKYIESLKIPEEKINEVLEKLQWLQGACESFDKFSTHLESVEEDDDTGGAAGVAMRQETIFGMKRNIEKMANEAFVSFQSIPEKFEDAESHLTRLADAISM